MTCTSMTGTGRVAAALAIGLLLPYAAQADLNIVGSTHGQNYQGAANPTGGQAAASIPLSLCDQNAQVPERFENANNIVDLTDFLITIPAGNVVVWRCQVTIGGNILQNFLFRYTGGFSAKAYGNIKAPYTPSPGTPDPASLFTSITPGGTGCVEAAGGNPKIDPGTGRSYNSFVGCSLRVLVQADFATSDTKGTAFSPNMCDPQTVPSCASPITDTGITSFPITATPFVMIVGNGVQRCDSAGNALGKITLNRLQVEAIFSGQVTRWGQLGYCVVPVVALNPPDAMLGLGAGDMAPPGSPGSDGDIVTCSRPVTAGTRIIFDATLMKDVPELSFGQFTLPFTGDINYLAPTVADGLACVQGRSAAVTTPANNNAIAYNRADEAASKLLFGAGNVGRMRGGYPVQLDGTLPSNYLAPLVIANPTDAERAAAQKDFRCGRYEFWSDWVGIQRNVSNPNQALWNRYVAAIGNLLPKTTAGYFWARNVRQPGQPINTEMFITKGPTKGPVSFEPGDHLACR